MGYTSKLLTPIIIIVIIIVVLIKRLSKRILDNVISSTWCQNYKICDIFSVEVGRIGQEPKDADGLCKLQKPRKEIL